MQTITSTSSPVPGQYWSDADSIGPVLAHYGMFMSSISYAQPLNRLYRIFLLAMLVDCTNMI